jgi:6 kDa early secretory antigenic target
MPNGDLAVDFGLLEAGAQDIKAGSSKLQSQLDDLESQLKKYQAEWTGSASQAYEAAKAQWHQAIQDMNAILTEIGQAVSASNQGYQDGEKKNASLFGG